MLDYVFFPFFIVFLLLPPPRISGRNIIWTISAPGFQARHGWVWAFYAPNVTKFFFLKWVRIRLIFWNIRGLNDKMKRSLFKFLQSHKPHVLFLQETHLIDSKILALKSAWVKQGFHATSSSYARGATILLSKSLPCSMEQVFFDPGGRYVILILEMCA